MNTIYKEGDLYKVISLFGKTFELRYGYYDDKDRASTYNEVIPIYPDFLKSPIYTYEGHPFVTQMQDICLHYDGDKNGEECFSCRHYQHGDDLIGICKCTGNKAK